jgi:hypothetical protein
MLLVFWKRSVFGPTFHLEISNDVRLGRCRRVITPKFAHLIYPGLVMPEPPMAHPVRRTPGKFIKPAMDFFKRFTEELE